jgi:quercetin dioxygenase-like cupin family protein
MATKQQSGNVDLNRRELLMLGLAGASALVLGKGSSVLAAEAKGVEIKVLKEAESMVPGFPKVRLREFTFQPGGRTAGLKMPNAMICECSLGALEVTQDDKTWTVKKGDIWTCKVGLTELAVNKGKTNAIMRVFDLLPA